MNKKMKKEQVIVFVTTIISWLTTALFLYWGWSVIAPHLNAPIFTYWEVVGIRLMFGAIMRIIGNSFKK